MNSLFSNIPISFYTVDSIRHISNYLLLTSNADSDLTPKMQCIEGRGTNLILYGLSSVKRFLGRSCFESFATAVNNGSTICAIRTFAAKLRNM